MISGLVKVSGSATVLTAGVSAAAYTAGENGNGGSMPTSITAVSSQAAILRRVDVFCESLLMLDILSKELGLHTRCTPVCTRACVYCCF